MNYFQDLSTKKKLGIIIKTNRKDRNMTQDDLAYRINCDQSVISRIEMGHESVDLQNYITALDVLGMDYQEEVNLDFLNDLFNDIWVAYEYEKMEILKSFETRVSQLIDKNNHILIEYHYGVLMFFFYYHKRDYEKCFDVYDYLKDIIYICDKKYQLLYLITVLNVSLLHHNHHEAKQVTEILLTNEFPCYQSFIQFYIGHYFFKVNNRSIALKYYLSAQDYFLQTNNYVRLVHIDLFINSLLVKERNFVLALDSYQKLIKYKSYLSEPLIHRLYFWIAYCYYAMKDYNHAIEYFNLSLEYSKGNDVNHIYYYLLMIYDQLEDFEHYKTVLSQIDYHSNHKYGTKIINLLIQSKMQSTNKYYEYIENEILPMVSEHYEKIEIIGYLVDLLNFYYENQQYAKYHDLAKILFENLA